MGGAWLDPLRVRLDAADEPVTFFFRDDDAGWADERLFELMGRFDERGLPIDLAAIPCAISESLAAELRSRTAVARGRVGVHQHGFAHVNQEREGRKQEFGPARSADEQREDIADGRGRLERLLDGCLDPVFTPPWNRCTPETGRSLAELGFRVLSREHRAEPLAVEGLAEVPVHVDWFAKRKGVRLEREAVGEQLAARAGGEGPIGVMFHHAEMDAAEIGAATELLDLLAGHASCRFASILELASDPGG